MPRRTRNVTEYLGTAQARLRRLSATPLRAVAEKLGRNLEEAKCAFEAGSLPTEKVVELCSYVSYIDSQLPQTFGERFFFDAAMIRAIAGDWGGSMILSQMVIPSYDATWGHRSFQMPSENLERVHLIHVILFPGDERLEEVDLLTYPWVAHELGHYVLFRDDSPFEDVFTLALQKRVQSLTLSAIADRGAAKVKAQGITDELFRFWAPSPDQKNWAHELAADIIALWTCGPAYLASFQDWVEQSHINPYEITKGHPPYEVRLRTLVDASRVLGFHDYTAGLKAVHKRWAESKWRSGKDNRFVTLADRSLADECRQAAFRFCESVKLAKWTPERLGVCRTGLADEPHLELGVDVFLSARMVLQEQGEVAFEEWERKTVHRLAQQIMRLSR